MIQLRRKPSVAVIGFLRRLSLALATFVFVGALSISCCQELEFWSSKKGKSKGESGNQSFPSSSHPNDSLSAVNSSTPDRGLRDSDLLLVSVIPVANNMTHIEEALSPPPPPPSTTSSSVSPSTLVLTPTTSAISASKQPEPPEPSFQYPVQKRIVASVASTTVATQHMDIPSHPTSEAAPRHDKHGNSQAPTLAGLVSAVVLNATQADESLSLGFEGTSCLGKAKIGDAFRKFCRKELFEPFYCGRAEHSDQCGWYQQGRFGSVHTPIDDSHQRPSPIPVRSFSHPEKVLNTKPFVLSSDSLASLYARMVSKLAKRRNTNNSTCADPRAFGSRINLSQLVFEGQSDKAVVQNTVCPFDYVPFGAPIAAVLHHHAVVSGRAEGRRGIVISGDSMMRQLFHHIIASIRGQDRIADYYYHNEGVYVVLPDGDAFYNTLDHKELEGFIEYWFPNKTSSAKKRDPPQPESIHPSLRQALFAVMFVWDPRPDPIRVNYPFIATSIGGHMYWNTDMGKYPAYHKAMEDLLANVSTRSSSSPSLGGRKGELKSVSERGGGKGYKHIHVTIPRRAANFSEAYRQKSNELNYNWVEGTAYPSQRKGEAPAPYLEEGQRRLWMLDFAAFEDANNATKANISKVSDTVHYQCGMLLRIGIKTNGLGCRDPMNEALMQWLLQLLLRL